MAGDALRDAFRIELQSIITSAGLSWPFVDTQNTTALPDASTGFISLEFPGGAERQFTFGSPGSNLHREEGQVTVRVSAPLGRSRDLAETAAAAIRTAFRMRRFAAGNGTVRITSTAPMGGGHDEAGLWVEAVALGYETYNVG